MVWEGVHSACWFMLGAQGLGLRYGRQLEDGQTDLIGAVLGSSASGKALGVARDIDVEEFVDSLPSTFQGSGLVNLAYVDAGLKHMELPEGGVDLVSVMRVRGAARARPADTAASMIPPWHL